MPSPLTIRSLLGAAAFLAGAAALGSPGVVPPQRRAPAVAANSDVLHLERRVRHGPNASSRAGFRSMEGVVDYKSRDAVGPMIVRRRQHGVGGREVWVADDGEPVAEGVGPAINAYHQIEYMTPVGIGGEEYNLIVDTGSSDTWFVKSGFECVNSRRQLVPFEACDFGPVFRGALSGGTSPLVFNITYGSANGPFLNGEMGFTDLKVANISVARQQVALATDGMWFGDGISSGILGLGLPALTASSDGTVGADGRARQVPYDPLVATINRQLASPVFSLALHRNSSESFIAFGGVPPNAATTGVWAATPIEKVWVDGVVDYFYYTALPDAISFNNSQRALRASNVPAFIVDSGTTLNLFPYEIAASINNLFAPPGVLDPAQGAWFVPCDATPPSLSVTLGGTVIKTHPSSMILPEVRDSRGRCASGIGYTDGFPYILGDVFMQNLVTVFDLGEKKEVRYAERVF
ncbi:hypothetical protein GGTG_07877 [Gaeumannomyces tritici R3-111a-1]|uniref:Peptidase A1 domain-containing protein n=1 Tax=Gaeumannomyces tritici (strain R3-111a-1) TaxID=644352 RepID=J3P2Y6_GAET3|nr:hypothetical protein GGTG_07877 [Gaeumannomyces tritici R3-111a-1]EJT74028.1 hypothetical protein GGTG_07877 [Gaeumannomyces tritici R3-111a-1]